MTISSSRQFLIVAFILAMCSLVPLVTQAGGDSAGGGGAASDLGFAADDATYGYDTQGKVGSNSNSTGRADAGTYSGAAGMTTAVMDDDGKVIGYTTPSGNYYAVGQPIGASTPTNAEPDSSRFGPPSTANTADPDAGRFGYGVPGSTGYVDTGVGSNTGGPGQAAPGAASGGNTGGNTGGYSGGGQSGGATGGNSGSGPAGSGSLDDNWWVYRVTGPVTNAVSNIFGWFFGGNSNVATTTEAGTVFDSGVGIACTMEAKMCPDGSYVGRTGPSCQFAACPTSTTTPTLIGSSTDAWVCAMDARQCPDGSFVGRTGDSCQFAACPTTERATIIGSTTAGGCATDAKMCPDGSYVGRTGDSCQFAACPNNAPVIGTPLFGGNNQTGTDSGVATQWPTFSGTTLTGGNNTQTQTGSDATAWANYIGNRNQTQTNTSARTDSGTLLGGNNNQTQTNNSAGTDSGVPLYTGNNQTQTRTGSDSTAWATFSGNVLGLVASNRTTTTGDSTASRVFNTVTGLLGGVTSAANPAVNLISDAVNAGIGLLFGNQTATTGSSYVNFGLVNMNTTSGTDSGVATTRSTSTLQTLLDSLYRRNQPTTTLPPPTPGGIGDSIFGGGTKPNVTNTIVFEVKIVNSNGSIRTDWTATTTTIAIPPAGSKLHFRWTATDYTQCLAFFNDNGRYALKTNDRTMTTGNTEEAAYEVPIYASSYRIECGGQKNDESGVDQRVINLTGTNNSDSGLFGISPDSGVGTICTMDAKMCPDGSYVGRSGPSCEFAACPSTSTTDSGSGTLLGGACTEEAKLCPDGSYVGRSGPSCEFAPCPTSTTNSGTDSGPGIFLGQ